MILPSKHITFSQSIFGLAGFLLAKLKTPMSIDELFQKYANTSRKTFPGYHDFDNVILAVDLLYLMGAITIDSKGKLSNEIN